MKVDSKTGAVLAHGADAEKPTDLGAVAKRVSEREQGLQDSFQKAVSAEKNRGKELEDLFKKAAEKVDDEPEKPGDHPLDGRWR